MDICEQTIYKECVEDIHRIMKYDEKLACGLILQIWCLNSYEDSFKNILSSLKHTIVNIDTDEHFKTFDVEFDSVQTGLQFKQKVSMSRQVRVYSNRINVCGKLYPKPNPMGAIYASWFK